MKKLVSLFIAVMLVVSLSVTAFGATMAFTAPEVEVGTTTADVNLAIAFDEDASIGMLQVNFLLPDGITLTAADFSEFTAKCDKVTDDNNFEIGQLLIYDDDMDVAVAADTTINIKFTFAIADSSTASVYDITLDDGNTMVINPDGDPLVEEFPATTITVKEAKAPFTAETVEGAKVTSEVNEVTIGDAVYTNVAIFTATLGTGEGNYSEAGFIWVKDGNKTDNKYTVDAAVISGTGTFEYTAAMFAIENGVKIEAIPYYVTAE